jgi:hypothetical protein
VALLQYAESSDSRKSCAISFTARPHNLTSYEDEAEKHVMDPENLAQNTFPASLMSTFADTGASAVYATNNSYAALHQREADSFLHITSARFDKEWFDCRLGCVPATGSYTLAKFALRAESDMPELRTATAKMFFDAVFGLSGEAAPALDDDANDGLTQGEQVGLDTVRSGVTYEQLRAYAREDLRRLATMHGVPLTDGQQARTTARNLLERMDIVPAENPDVTDDDEEVQEVRRLSPLTFEADGDFASEVRAGLYAEWFLKRTRPTSAIWDARLNLNPTL